jgi:hypothetical protein
MGVLAPLFAVGSTLPRGWSTTGCCLHLRQRLAFAVTPQKEQTVGNHVELVASLPRPILWGALSQAGQAQGWRAHGTENELRLERDGILVTRVVLSDGAARESYRNLTDGYIHPDDRAAHAQTALPSPEVVQMRKRERGRSLFRLILLPTITAGSGCKVWADFQ